jgi:UDP-N-acetylglucosamine--N-acetylmuramyl-(pentapeptide) pyrophosphoryl-undecaprenol N-acetylglucosamine transferase
MKRILVVGGGSGGHVTPVVSVLHELHEKRPWLEVRFWCDAHFAPQTRKIIADYKRPVRVQTVLAGKFRRYHHLSKLQHLTIPSVIFPNIRDVFLVFFGVVQSVTRLLFWRPDVVFAKGGYVCLPVGYAAWLLRIPLVIHDSDAVPGLTNRLLAPIAKRIATGVPLEHYNYPEDKAQYVGVPIDPAYRLLTLKEKRDLKTKLGFDVRRPLTVFAGGGQGSKQINDAVALHLQELLKFTNVLLLAGASQYDELRSLTPQGDPRFVLKDFVPGLPEVFGAADVVVSRAGATQILELAALAVPTIVVPSKRLIWQIQHTNLYVDKHAVLLLDEDDFKNSKDRSLVTTIKHLLEDETLRKKLGANLHAEAMPNAAKDMAAIIEKFARKRK